MLKPTQRDSMEGFAKDAKQCFLLRLRTPMARVLLRPILDALTGERFRATS